MELGFFVFHIRTAVADPGERGHGPPSFHAITLAYMETQGNGLPSLQAASTGSPMKIPRSAPKQVSREVDLVLQLVEIAPVIVSNFDGSHSSWQKLMLRIKVVGGGICW